jgi:hypothetical protein
LKEITLGRCEMAKKSVPQQREDVRRSNLREFNAIFV